MLVFSGCPAPTGPEEEEGANLEILSVIPETIEVEPGEEFGVGVVLANTGDLSDVQCIELAADGTVLGPEEKALSGGEEATVTLRGDTGQLDQPADRFTVRTAADDLDFGYLGMVDMTGAMIAMEQDEGPYADYPKFENGEVKIVDDPDDIRHNLLPAA